MEWLWYIGGGFLIGSIIGAFRDSSNSSDEDSSLFHTSDDYSLNDIDHSSFDSSCPSINPASGLPMISDSCIDVEGNPFGTSSSSFDSSNDLFDDSSISSFSSDPFDTTTI